MPAMTFTISDKDFAAMVDRMIQTEQNDTGQTYTREQMQTALERWLVCAVDDLVQSTARGVQRVAQDDYILPYTPDGYADAVERLGYRKASRRK